jgi:flagellar motility protein MotE (MotC chaperone)
MKKILLSPRILLPLAVLLGLFVVITRAADMWEIVSSGKLLVRAAQAEDTHEPAKDASAPKTEAPIESKTGAPPPSDAETSPAELDVLKQLSDRREQLEKRSRDIDTREALLKVTEQRIAQKVKELETLRGQVQTLVNQAGGAQQAQLDNLVKIYETMKPDEAARIFETLDMPVLMGVIKLMKPARTAPIMAKMPPEKAKEVTVALTKQDQLPQAK